MTLYGLDLWAGALLFARIGALIMLLPALGEAATPATARLSLALVLTVILAPALEGSLPPMPARFQAAAGLIVWEALIGLALGSVARMLFAALDTAGQIIGMETGLSFAQTSDPTQMGSGQLFSVFLSLMGVALIFATDLHHGFLQAISGSYGVFAPGEAPSLATFSELAVQAASDSLRIAVQICAPLILAGLVYRAGLAVLARVIPQIQVFFITTPVNILGGYLILALALSTGGLVWLDRMAAFATGLE